MAIFVTLTVLSWCPTSSSADEEESYGVDVSFPIHRRVSTNYAWLKHNTDPAHNDVPTEYRDMPLQPLGDRQASYVRHVEGCRKYYANKANYCDIYEYDRMLMNLRQPQSMQVSSRTQAAFMILFFLYLTIEAHLACLSIFANKNLRIIRKSVSRRFVPRWRSTSLLRVFGKRINTTKLSKTGRKAARIQTLGRHPRTWSAWMTRVSEEVGQA